jgi:NADH-quinone oxidoreductase subunit E
MSAVPQASRLLSDGAYAQIERELAKFPPDRRQSAIMAALAIAQAEIGWVSSEVIEDVARTIGIEPIAVEEVATFYNMFSTQPVGKFKLAVCTCLPCALRDGAKAGEYLKDRLGIGYGETTADGLFTLQESECQGACGDAPVLIVNNQRQCSFMSAERLDALLAELRDKA